MHMKISALLGFLHLVGINLVKPVLAGYYGGNMKVHTLQTEVHIGIFFYPPVAPVQIVFNNFIILNELSAIPHDFMLFAIKYISLGSPVMAVFNQNLFY